MDRPTPKKTEKALKGLHLVANNILKNNFSNSKYNYPIHPSLHLQSSNIKGGFQPNFYIYLFLFCKMQAIDSPTREGLQLQQQSKPFTACLIGTHTAAVLSRWSPTIRD